MKTTYTLAWEEYSEQLSESWQRPDYFAAIVVAMVATPLFVYGVVLAFFSSEALLNYMFIGGPLLLLGGALFSITPWARKNKRKQLKEIRLQYEQRFAQQQTFSFDQERWTHETEAGKQEVPWAALQTAIEWPSVFYLKAETSSVFIPRRMFDLESLTQFQQMARLTGQQEWEYRVRWQDYQMVNMLLLWRRAWFMMIPGNLLGLGALVWIAQSWLSQGALPGLIWGWILAAFAVVMALTAQVWYLPLKYATSPRSDRGLQKLRLSGTGICFTTVSAIFFLAWKRLRKFKEMERAFLLYISASTFYLVPKRDFTPDQQDQLRQMLKEKVPAN